MIEFHRSSNKHGVHVLDIVHALQHSLTSFELEPDADPPRVLTIGPDRAGSLLEVIMLDLADNRQIVIHAMKLRRQFKPLAPRTKGTP